MFRRDFISRAGFWLSVLAGVAWVISLGFNVTYFGDNVTVAYLEGYVGVYWGSDPHTRNSGVMNSFTWPYFGGGGGMEWTPAWHWQVGGPRTLLSRKWIEYEFEYPKKFGLYLPGVGRSVYGSYIGTPMWTLALLGVSSFALFRKPRGSRHPDRCLACGYDISGLHSACCSECGIAIPRRDVQSARAMSTQAFEQRMRQGGDAAIEQASLFFMKNDPVHHSLREIARRLEQLKIPYAIVGGMALVAHGYDRTTVDVDILLTAEGLSKARAELQGLGYVPPFVGSKNLRDTKTGVRIEFLVTGHYPGDGKPKPVAFPNPAGASVVIDGIRYITLPKLVELKLASGMTQPARRRDLADVQDLIRTLNLDATFADSLDPYVRPAFLTLVEELRDAGPDDQG